MRFFFSLYQPPPAASLSHASRGTEYQSDAVHRFQGEIPPKEAFKKLLIKTVERGGGDKKKSTEKGKEKKKRQNNRVHWEEEKQGIYNRLENI